MLDCTYRVQVSHRMGQLARVTGAIAEGRGLIGDVVTISIGAASTSRTSRHRSASRSSGG